VRGWSAQAHARRMSCGNGCGDSDCGIRTAQDMAVQGFRASRREQHGSNGDGVRGAGASACEPERRAAAAWMVLEQGPAVPAVTRETREGDARSGAGGCYLGTGTRSSPPSGHGKETAASQGHHHKWSTHDEGQRIGREDASSLARGMHEGRRVRRRGGESKATVIARRARKEQRQGQTGSGGRSNRMASQLVERKAKLHDLEVRVKLNRRVRECERKCFTSGRLGSFPQACALRQPITREQIGGRWCGSRAEAAHRRCSQARRSCRRLRGCADRVSAAHTREQWRLSCEQENPEVHGGVGIANQSGSIVFSHEFTTSSSSYPSLITQPTTVTTGYREKYLSGYLPPTTTIPGKLLRHPWSLIIVELFSSPILFIVGIHFSPVFSTTKATPRFALFC
jgi:hypothetical protein